MKASAKQTRVALLKKLKAEHSLGQKWYTHDGLPQLERPYGIIGVITYIRDDAQTVSGTDNLVSLHVYGDTDDEVDGYMAEIVNLLDDSTLTLTDDLTAWWVLMSGTASSVREGAPDNRHSHGTQTIRVRATYTG